MHIICNYDALGLGLTLNQARAAGVVAVSAAVWRRALSDLSVAVGFGVSTAEQVREVWRFADAAVVGRAIVSQIEKLAGSPDLVSRVGAFARSLVAPAD
jgi:tryptophan synthase alpha subunit